jgi:hypothetical protein
VGMAGRYTGSYPDRPNGWRAVATLADIGRASLVGRIPKGSIKTFSGRRQQDSVLINRGNRNIIGSQRIRFALMRYSLHETDKHRVVATTVAADRDEALEWFSEKLRLMLTFEGDPASADYLLDESPEGLPYLATHTPKPTIPVFVVSAVAAHPQASKGAGCGQTGA